MSDSALTLAIKLLARREHSAHELRQKLMQREVSSDACAAVLNRLRQSDLQSDRRFSEAYLRQKQSAFGDFRLRAELSRRGVAKEDIEVALSAAPPPPEAARACAVLRKKYPRGVSAAEEATARRFLHTRGFCGESIRAALEACR